MQNARLGESQAGIKIARRNFNNFIYAHHTTLMAENEEELQTLFTFFHKSGVIWISEVIEISPGNLDSSLCFIQPAILHDVLRM